MAYRFQLSDAKNSRQLKAIAGTCSSTQDFIDLVNEGQRVIVKRGNWHDTVWKAKFCIYSCMLTWPRYVKTILAAKFNNSDGARVENGWFSFIAPVADYSWLLANNYGGVVFEDLNKGPILDDISGSTGKHLRYHVSRQNDLGKKITFFGQSYGSQPLMESVSGAWVAGLTLAASAPYSQTIQQVINIQSITREQTEANGYLYEWGGGDNPQFPITISGAGSTSVNVDMTWRTSFYSSPTGSRKITFNSSDNKWHLTVGAVEYYTSYGADLFGAWVITAGGPALSPVPVVLPTNPTDGDLRLIGIYEPNETNPQYRRSKIHGYGWRGGCVDTNNIRWKQIEALIKLEFIPVQNDRDFLAIDDFQALAYAIQSIRCADAQDYAGQTNRIQAAIAEMNMGEREENPEWQTPVRANTFGSYGISNPI